MAIVAVTVLQSQENRISKGNKFSWLLAQAEVLTYDIQSMHAARGSLVAWNEYLRNRRRPIISVAGPKVKRCPEIVTLLLRIFIVKATDP